jgi:hypothetical protein
LARCLVRRNDAMRNDLKHARRYAEEAIAKVLIASIHSFSIVFLSL